MKVLNVNMTLDAVMGGGTAERTFQISRNIAKKGISCTVLTTDLGLNAQRINELEGVRVIALPTLQKRFYLPKFSYKYLMEIIKEADIIHLMNHWTLINALVYFMARRLKKPYVVCPAGSLSVTYRSKLLKDIFNLFVGKRIIKNANRLIAITADEIPYFQKYGVSLEKISVIPNGIDIIDSELTGPNGFKEKYRIPDGPFLLFVGRLHYVKGPDLLLQAFVRIAEKYREYHLVFIGPDDGMLADINKLISVYKMKDRVHLIGYVGGQDKVMAYHAADLLVIPSRQEAMSVVVLEAGATGTPVLITDRCGFGEIADYQGGLVVPASVKGLEEGLDTLLQKPEKLSAMGDNLKKYTMTYFTWEVMIKKYLELFAEILYK